jgi:hypothetical protein
MKVFVCSPLRGSYETNLQFAREFCRYVALQGHAPFAPHVFCTQFLHEETEAERNCGIEIGLAFLKSCDELWWASPLRAVSTGMSQEIAAAEKLKIPVRHCIEFSIGIYWRSLSQNGSRESKPRYD